VVWSGDGRLRVFRGEYASVNDYVHVDCHMKGGVDRWWEVERIQS
jgi:hypothetical protein